MKQLNKKLLGALSDDNKLRLLANETFDYDIVYKDIKANERHSRSIICSIPFALKRFVNFIDAQIALDNNDQYDKRKSPEALEYANESYVHMLRLSNDEDVADCMLGIKSAVNFYSVDLNKAIEAYIKFVATDLMCIPADAYVIDKPIYYLTPSEQCNNRLLDIESMETSSALKDTNYNVILIPLLFSNNEYVSIYDSYAQHQWEKHLYTVTHLASTSPGIRIPDLNNLGKSENVWRLVMGAELFEIWNSHELALSHISDYPFVTETYKTIENHDFRAQAD